MLGCDRVDGEALNIMTYHGLHQSSGNPRLHFAQHQWYKEEAFAIEKSCNLRWYLMLLESPLEARDMDYEEHLAMLPLEYEMPLAVEEVMKDLSYCLKNGAYVNTVQWARCRDVPDIKPDYHVVVGLFSGQNGLFINACSDSYRDLIGLGASRRLPE